MGPEVKVTHERSPSSHSPQWQHPRESMACVGAQRWQLCLKFSKGISEPRASPDASVMPQGSERQTVFEPRLTPLYKQLFLIDNSLL